MTQVYIASFATLTDHDLATSGDVDLYDVANPFALVLTGLDKIVQVKGMVERTLVEDFEKPLVISWNERDDQFCTGGKVYEARIDNEIAALIVARPTTVL